MMIPIKKVCEQLGLSRETVRKLEKNGRLKKHKLLLTTDQVRKQTAARYDSDEVNRLEIELKRGCDGVSPAAPARVRRLPARTQPGGSLAFRKKGELIDFA